MSFLGVDLGGTKLSLAVFNIEGQVLYSDKTSLSGRKGTEVGTFITEQLATVLHFYQLSDPISSIGICIPGINHIDTGTVWVPNIDGWENYPLVRELQTVCGDIPVTIDSDRACYISGEIWQGNAKGCCDAIFLSVGTGIGAGILAGGKILRGAHDIAGAIGWMALSRPFENKYKKCGGFEHYASGEGIALAAREILALQKDYRGELNNTELQKISSADVFTAYANNDVVAREVITSAVEYWGMAVANLVSLFDPEKIIFGGGVFGPAIPLIPLIKEEALKWAQPISMKLVGLEPSALGGEAGVYGAGYLALQNQHLKRQ